MPVYLVSYDLKAPGKDYKKLIAELVRIGGAKILLSQWIISVAGPARKVADDLKSYMDANDSVFVVEITKDADWAGTGCLRPGAAKLKALRP